MSDDIYQANAPGSTEVPSQADARVLKKQDQPEHRQQQDQEHPQGQNQQKQQSRQTNGVTSLRTTPFTTSTANGRPRTATDTAEIDETLSHPGSVRINVKGAFIVDQDAGTPTTPTGSRSGSPGHQTKDIRLPNHTAVVSHIAVDVRILSFLFPHFADFPLTPSTMMSSRIFAVPWLTGLFGRPMTDRWHPCQACLLLPRTALGRARWPAQLHQLRDRSHRRMHRIYAQPQAQAPEIEWWRLQRQG